MTNFDIFTGEEESVEDLERRANIEEDDDADLSEKLLDQYASGPRSTWVQEAKSDDDFRHGAQLTETERTYMKQRNMPPLIVNVIQPAVESAKALLTSNRPRFSSVGREDSDTRTGKIFADLLTYIWDISEGNVKLKQAIDDYYVKGMGVLYTYYDPYADFGKGEIFIDSIDPLEVFVDPNAKDIFARDAAHILLMQTKTKEHLLSCYPDFKEKIKHCKKSDSRFTKVSSGFVGNEGQAETEAFSDMSHDTYDIIDRYSKLKVNRYHMFDPSSLEERIMTEEEFEEFRQEQAFILEHINGEMTYVTSLEQRDGISSLYMDYGDTLHYEQDPMTGEHIPVPGVEDSNSIQGSTIFIHEVTMGDMVELEQVDINYILVDRILRVISIGGITYFKGVYEIDNYPIVPIMNRHRRNPFPLSDVRFVRPLQEQVNKIESLIVAHAANATSIKLLIPRGSMNKKEVLQEWSKVGAAVIEFDGELGAPTVAGPVPLPNELYKNKQDKINEIERILGVYSIMDGNPADAPATFKGTVALDEYGQRRIKSKKDDIEACLNQLAKIVVQLIQRTYTEPKTFRLLSPNNPPQTLEINTPIYDDITGRLKYKLNDVTVGKYDVVVVSGSMLPSNRWAQFEYYFNLYQAGAIDQVELLKKTEIVDVEGVLNRHSELMAMKQQLEAAVEEIKNLKGDLQTATRESMHDRKRVELEKFKTRLKDAEATVDKSKELYDARTQDQLRMHQKELNLERKKQNADK